MTNSIRANGHYLVKIKGERDIGYWDGEGWSCTLFDWSAFDVYQVEVLREVPLNLEAL
jgi:hypothetical protein